MSGQGGDDDELVPRPPQDLRDDIARWYHEHEQFYRTGPWPNLQRVRDRFDAADREEQEALATLSYIHTVMTIQTKMKFAEEVYQILTSGRKTIFHAMLDGSMYDAKTGHIRSTLGGSDDIRPMVAIEETAATLDRNDVEGALLALEENAKGISTRKAPFVLANLGFTSQMCLNLNVADVLDIEPDEFSFEEYQDACFRIEELFPDLSREITEPYHLQWVLFDYNRNKDVRWEVDGRDVQVGLAGQKERRVIVRPGRDDGPVDHDAWFTSVLEPSRDELVATMRLLEKQAAAPVGGGPVGGGLDVFTQGFGDPPSRRTALQLGYTAAWFDNAPEPDDDQGDDTEQSGLLDF